MIADHLTELTTEQLFGYVQVAKVLFNNVDIWEKSGGTQNKCSLS